MAEREIEDLDQLRQALAAGTRLRGLQLQGLDLTGAEGQLLLRRDCAGLVVLGGALTPDLERHLRSTGATIFPSDPGCPVDPYRARLYAATELYDRLRDGGYRATPDALAYAWSQDANLARDAFATLLRAIHDHSMTDALDELVAGRRVVGVMGGHALERGTPPYAEAAWLGHRLAEQGATVLTGGGPGAMEAANLGALCRSETDLDHALDQLAAVPSFRPSIDEWALLAWQVRERLAPVEDPGPAARSVGVPTWFYGHEPPNLFAESVAKFFSNALREDLLISRCTGGIVVLPGAAGTAQEIFQAVTPLYYAATDAALPPLVLVDRTHWERTIPVWPTLQALGADRSMTSALSLVDTPHDAARLLEPPRGGG